MANAFNKEEVVLFEQILEGFDADNLSAKNCSVFRPGSTLSERTNGGPNGAGDSTDVVWRPQPYITRTVSGRDLTGNFDDLTQMSVPASANITENIPWKLDAWELRDPLQRDRISQSAVQQLSATVNRSVANLVGLTGSLVVTSASAASGYADIADAESRIGNEEISLDSMRCYMANMNDYKQFAADLANRETMQGKPNAAYERSYVGPVAGFDTYRTSFQPTLAGSSGSTTTRGGAQRYIPLATQTNAINGGESNVDNRFMDLTVTASASFAVGDVITVAGVNAVSMINKEDIGELRTFRVTDIPDGTTLTITPPIIVSDGSSTTSEDQYANCSAEAANGAAVTAINTTTARVNSFWVKDSIEIYEGRLALPASDMAGLATMQGSTDSGIQLILAKQGDINDLTAKYRWTIYYGTTNLNPQMNGIQLFNQ